MQTPGCLIRVSPTTAPSWEDKPGELPLTPHCTKFSNLRSPLLCQMPGSGQEPAGGGGKGSEKTDGQLDPP